MDRRSVEEDYNLSGPFGRADAHGCWRWKGFKVEYTSKVLKCKGETLKREIEDRSPNLSAIAGFNVNLDTITQ